MAIGVIDKPRNEAAEPPEGRVVLHGITWKAYEELLRCRGPRRGTRLTFDDGDLEIMTLGYRHESNKMFLAYLVVTYVLECGIPMRNGGSMTFKSKAKKKGFEPDACFWIQNQAKMRDKTEFDIVKDPPPDLAIEIEITSSELDRMGIYAALGVPEIWRYDGDRFTIHVLDNSGSYVDSETSLTLPNLPIPTLVRFLSEAVEVGETETLQAFRDWLRTTAAKDVKKKRSSNRPRKS